MKTKNIFSFISFIGFLVFVLFAASCSSNNEKKELSKTELIERGKYLVEFGGCNDCHSPKKFVDNNLIPDPSLILSGHPATLPLPPIDKSNMGPGKWTLANEHLTAWVGPWGVSFAANITPDLETGIGGWAEAVFINTMRTGKHLGAGRPILPPMPWFGLNALTDEDLSAIFNYLQTLKPIKNKVPDPIPPTP